VSYDYLPPGDVHYSHVHWLDELDALGPGAPLDLPERHLAKAPLPREFDVGFLTGFIAALRVMK